MASGDLTNREQTGPLTGTFLGPSLDIKSERLYDLTSDIPDVMGLRALRPSAAIVSHVCLGQSVYPGSDSG